MSKWEMVKLGDIGEFQSGGTPTRQEPQYFSGKIPWITTVKLRKMHIDENDAAEFITEEAIRNSATKKIPPYSLMIGIRVGVGKASINRVEMCTSQDIISISNIDESLFSQEYLIYCIKSYVDFFNSQKRGATIQGITSGLLKDLSIPFPPLEIQKSIAQTLDAASELIALYKKQLAELDNLIKSIFYEMFGDPVTNELGWEVKLLEELSSLITKGSSPTWQGIEYGADDKQVLFITSENVKSGYLDLSKKKFLQTKFNQIQSRSILKQGDVLINIVGASIGRAAIYTLNNTSNINQAVALVRLSNFHISEPR